MYELSSETLVSALARGRAWDCPAEMLGLPHDGLDLVHIWKHISLSLLVGQAGHVELV